MTGTTSDTRQEATEASTSKNEASAQTTPSLSAREHRIYNRMAQGMNLYHNHFRMEWNHIYKACEEASSPDEQEPKVSTSVLARMILQFISHLTAHHNIEEQHIFPLLGERMPEFNNSDPSNLLPGGPVAQHRDIHAGLDKLDDYLSACRAGEKNFQRQDIKAILDSFGEVLWKHLDDEVALLGAENMRKYWTLDQMKMMPM